MDQIPGFPYPRRTVLRAGGLGALAALSACRFNPLVPALAGCAESAWVPDPAIAALAPPAPREMRAAWVATVANIDWPSRKGLSSAEQQAQVHAVLDAAQSLGLNAIFLQVRTSADALYASELEPWSEYLSGVQGQPPEPWYDPLALWVQEAHRRGLELHAWFNPFRARAAQARSATAPTHLSQTQPSWVLRYGDQEWIDPGHEAAVQHTLAVFADVVRRYDIDGVHIDDYFYPYPVARPGNAGETIPFPDDASWARYQVDGGTASRADWRRSNVNRLIERLMAQTHAQKPWVRFGISPFGLGRPQLRAPGILGFSQYDQLYADVEHWLEQGWLDYLVPQLYWRLDAPAQAFATLLDTWHRHNPHQRPIYAGLFTSKVAGAPPASPSAKTPPGWEAEEILNQIATVRARAPGSGHAHFSMVALLQNRSDVAQALRSHTYTAPALVPPSPWLALAAPEAPQVRLTCSAEGHVQLQCTNASATTRWALWQQHDQAWSFSVPMGAGLSLPAVDASARPLQALVLSALNRTGLESVRVGFRVKLASSPRGD